MKYLPTDNSAPIKYQIQVEAKAYIQIPDPEFDALFKLCEAHYDHDVREITKQGGFLYGSRNSRILLGKNPTDDPKDAEHRIEIKFDQRRLGLCLKAIEMDMNDTCYNLAQELWRVLQDLQDVQTSVNNKLLAK